MFIRDCNSCCNFSVSCMHKDVYIGCLWKIRCSSDDRSANIFEVDSFFFSTEASKFPRSIFLCRFPIAWVNAMFFYLDNPVESIVCRACAHSRETESRSAAFFRTRTALNRGHWRNAWWVKGKKGRSLVKRYLASKKLWDILTGGRHVTSCSNNTHEGCSKDTTSYVKKLHRKCRDNLSDWFNISSNLRN